MSLEDDPFETPDPAPVIEQPKPDPKRPRDRIREALERHDGPELSALIDPMPLSAALRQLYFLDAPMQVDLIGDLDAEEAEAILAEFDPEDAADLRRLAEYEDLAAGGLMTSDVFSCHETQTVAAILRDFARDDEDLEHYGAQYPYVVDKAERPVGVVSPRGLLRAKRTDRLAKIMIAPVITVPVTATLDELQDLFDRYGFLGIPVVEADGRLFRQPGRLCHHA